MTTYKCKIIHPTPAADFTMIVRADHEQGAYSIACRRLWDTYGADTLLMVSEVARV